MLVEHKDRALQEGAYFYRQSAAQAELYFIRKEIHVITGVRRCGKSHLMRMLMRHLVDRDKINPRQLLYLNFEDERFVDFEISDFQRLYEVFLDLEQPDGKKYFFLDELQNVAHWQRWVNRLYEFTDIKMFITGSNATMLSGEIATSLTGRNRIIELYPFSFAEFTLARGSRPGRRDFFKPEIKASLMGLFNRYLAIGGFPEPIKTRDTSILQDYFRDILYRDIVARHGLKNVRQLKELALYLAANPGCLISLKTLKNIMAVKSQGTVKNYLGHLEDTFLFFKVDLFSYSLKQQIYNPSKIYCIDHGLAAAVGFKFSADIGRTMENIVCIELKRQGHEIYYWHNDQGVEVDFVLKQGNDIAAIIQVCRTLEKEATRQREIRGGLAAAQEFKLDRVTIITENTWREEKHEGIFFDIVPIWKWLLDHTE